MNEASDRSLRILLVEDDPGDVELFRASLEQAGAPAPELDCVAWLSHALERLSERSYDVLVVDLSLPDALGMETVSALRDRAHGIPIVVMTGLDDEMVGVEAVRKGAQDFLVKGQTPPGFLVRALRYAVERHRLREEVERRTAEETQLRAQLLHAEKLTELGSLLAGVAHELKTPIGSIVGFAELLQSDLELEGDAARQLELLLGEARRAARMLGDLTAFSRPREMRRARICLNESVRAVLELLAPMLRVNRISVETRLDEALAPVDADPDRIRQIVLNLVMNAVEAMRAERPAGKLQLSTSCSKHDAVLTIEDNGPGVPEEIRNRIFEPFFSTKAERGTGLGLSIISGIVEEHGGSISVVDGANGARFVVSLPLAEAAVDRSTVDGPAAPSDEPGESKAPRHQNGLIDRVDPGRNG